MKILAIDEKWIKNYENLYSISKDGVVTSYVHKKPRKMRNDIDKDGYFRIVLCKNKTRKKYFVHRLVAQTFILNPENKPEVNHKNGIKYDNRVQNLEWVTRKENEIHAYKNGLANSNGAKRHNSKAVIQLSKNSDKIIREYESIRQAERETGIHNESISMVCNNKQKTAGNFVWRFKEECI